MSAVAVVELVALGWPEQVLAMGCLLLRLLLLLHRMSNELVSLHDLGRHCGEAVLLWVPVFGSHGRSMATFGVIRIELMGLVVRACCSMQRGA